MLLCEHEFHFIRIKVTTAGVAINRRKITFREKSSIILSKTNEIAIIPRVKRWKDNNSEYHLSYLQRNNFLPAANQIIPYDTKRNGEINICIHIVYYHYLAFNLELL